MTAHQLIEEFRKLSPVEQEEVRAKLAASPESSGARILPRKEARKISRELFSEYDELFRKLAK